MRTFCLICKRANWKVGKLNRGVCQECLASKPDDFIKTVRDNS